MKRTLRTIPMAIAAGASAGLCTGCSTLATHGISETATLRYQDDVYRGVRYNADWFGGEDTYMDHAGGNPVICLLGGIMFMVPDFACSACLDTVFLPYDAGKMWADAPPSRGEPEKKPEDERKPLEQQ